MALILLILKLTIKTFDINLFTCSYWLRGEPEWKEIPGFRF